MNERKNTPEMMEGYKSAGVRRALCERELLSLMFNGFSVITLNEYSYDYVSMFEHFCSLEEYTHMTRADLDADYSGLTIEAKKYYHLMIALNALEGYGLVEKQLWFECDDSPQTGIINLVNSVNGTDGESVAWLARALISKDRNQKQYNHCSDGPGGYYDVTNHLEYINYLITPKGYNVAIRFLEHSDQESRFDQQRTVSIQAANASTSSAKTAKWAIGAASAIALGSIANVAISLMIHYKCI